MGIIVEGIPRGCQGLFTPVSLGYPLSVFNKNSTLKRARYYALDAVHELGVEVAELLKRTDLREHLPREGRTAARIEHPTLPTKPFPARIYICIVYWIEVN